ncbi:MAG: F0F1 ATP synthase subunit A [Bacteroidales bacterium]|jgi:F-type H+-transporting ATPase subunit a|nr:F0F1 ATP synthase subunit A [Bacteroidales bacterium]
MHICNCLKAFYRILQILLFANLMLISLPKAQASTEEVNPKKRFDAGATIIEHVVDAYEWHIMTIGEKHISIPLPVILINDGKLHIFSSSKFHHGHESYKGFSICHEKGPKKGKIVKIDESGAVDNKASIIDLSITKNVFSLFISIFFLLLIFLSAAKSYTKNGIGAPKGVARIVEPLLLFVRDDIVKPSVGPKYEKYLPFLLTVFFFILFNNLFGLIPFFPGGANLTGNISVTFVLAFCTFIITNVSGNRDYWKHIINAPGVPWWLKFPLPLMPIVELVGVFTKPIVLMIRLFANITAGHIIALGFICLIFILGESNFVVGYGVSVASVLFYVFMGVIELLVAFIQAYVFTLLSSIYIGMAIEEHHHEHGVTETH